jgi:acyl carrier protein
MAEASEEVTTYLALLGLAPMAMDRACEYLDVTLGLDLAQASICDIDWARWATMHPTSAPTPRFAEQVRASGADGSASNALRAELAAMPLDERVEVVTYILAEQLATVLGIPAETIDVRTPLPDLGLDSLMAVELGARVNTVLDVEISALEFSRGGGLAAFAGRLVDQMGGARPVPAAGAGPVVDLRDGEVVEAMAGAR